MHHTERMDPRQDRAVRFVSGNEQEKKEEGTYTPYSFAQYLFPSFPLASRAAPLKQGHGYDAPAPIHNRTPSNGVPLPLKEEVFQNADVCNRCTVYSYGSRDGTSLFVHVHIHGQGCNR